MTNLRTAALLVAVVLGTGCAPGEVAGGAGEDEAQDALRQCAGGVKTPGVDVSYYQQNINWDYVGATNRGNKSFAFIRAADGTHVDSKFTKNWAGAAEAGLYRGAYAFFRAGDDPVQQAEALLDAIDHQIGPQDLPPVVDIEVRDGMSSATVASRALTMLRYLENALGRKPLVYTGSGFQALIGNPSSLAAYPLWVANWTTACPSMPARWSNWRFWQNKVGSAGSVSGISTKIDLDYFNGSEAELAAYAGPNGED